MTALYNIAPAHRELADRLRSMGLDDDAVADTLEAESDLPGKVETYCIVLREKEAAIEAYKREKERFDALIKSEDNAVTRMKEALLTGLQVAGEKTVKAGTFTVAIQGAKGRVIIEDEKLLPSDYLTSPEPPTPQPNKNAIYKALNDGYQVPGCRLQAGVRLAIK
ncbi:siphovirus Gp157 family protein [Pusillimonas sp. SM2304]|uniref:siphovirus Gp157 family protein n=1 Tax=Pusillimonas sp. SM2304 TaxID=3073241 RepID=UPI002876A0E5|nr:siphovirus Gp157 family protein [Pusillimonas sp. SM2304]MDS1142424.1 siphovirus Gp157 family protein [Pusillimonas sp. SM2304]